MSFRLQKIAILLGVLGVLYGEKPSLSDSFVNTYSTESQLQSQSANKETKYVFDPDTLNSIGLQAAKEVDDYLSHIPPEVQKELAVNYFTHSNPSNENLVAAFRKETILDRTQALLAERYPGKIMTDSPWAWNNVGGIFGRIRFLYCSFNEYVALFGTDIKQAGFSGRYKYMTVYDIMLTGRMDSEGDSSTDSLPVTYTPGKLYSELKKGDTRIYNMDQFTYMIDYSRGHITPAFWQGVIAPYLFTNYDGQSLKSQFKSCGLSIYRVIFGLPNH